MLRANLLAAVNLMLACADAGCRRLVLAGSMEEPELGDPEAVAQSPYAVVEVGRARLCPPLPRALRASGRPSARLHGLRAGTTRSAQARALRDGVAAARRGRRSSQAGRARWTGSTWTTSSTLSCGLRLRPGSRARSLDVGSGELVTARAIVVRLRDLVGGDAEPTFGAIADRQLERVRAADPTSAAEAMGWRPRMPLDEGLQRTVEFYRSHLDSPASSNLIGGLDEAIRPAPSGGA